MREGEGEVCGVCKQKLRGEGQRWCCLLAGCPTDALSRDKRPTSVRPTQTFLEKETGQIRPLEGGDRPDSFWSRVLPYFVDMASIDSPGITVDMLAWLIPT